MNLRKGSKVDVVGSFVFDGDTFKAKVDNGGKGGNQEVMVRIYGIDAPEKRQYGAGEATEELKRMVLKKNLQLHCVDVDNYGRAVCVVFSREKDTPGLDVGYKMIRDGNAKASIYGNSKALFATKYYLAQEAAKVGLDGSGRGLWKDDSKFTDPKEHREKSKKTPRNDTFTDADNYDREQMRLRQKERERMHREAEEKRNTAGMGRERKSIDRVIVDFLGKVGLRLGGEVYSDKNEWRNLARERSEKRSGLSRFGR